MYRSLDLNNELECELMHPIEARLRNMFLEMVRKHGNGLMMSYFGLYMKSIKTDMKL